MRKIVKFYVFKFILGPLVMKVLFLNFEAL